MITANVTPDGRSTLIDRQHERERPCNVICEFLSSYDPGYRSFITISPFFLHSAPNSPSDTCGTPLSIVRPALLSTAALERFHSRYSGAFSVTFSSPCCRLLRKLSISRRRCARAFSLLRSVPGKDAPTLAPPAHTMLARALDLLQWPFAPRRGSDPRLGSKFTRRLLHIMLILAFLSIISYVLSMKNARPDIRIPQRPIYSYAPGRGTDLHIHDPSIVSVDGTFYAYGHGEHIPIHKAPNLDGPWTFAGSVLDHDSVIEKGNRKLLWAPTTVEVDGLFYCYYSVSKPGSRDSAVGVATSASPGPGGWTDHGAVVQSGTGDGSTSHPFDISNAIDPSAIVVNGQGYLNFGSYWTGIWQVPLGWDLVSAATQSKDKSARHLAFEPWAVFPRSKNTNPLYGDPTGGHPVEGAFISYHAPYYYLWYSWGKCCDFNPKHLPIRGNECVHPCLSTTIIF